MDRLRQDIRYALRALVGNKAITLVAILSLGLGIGATSSIFSVVDVFMIRPLPFPDSHELVLAWTTNQDRGWSSTPLSPADFQDYRRESGSVALSAYHSRGANLSGTDRPQRLTVFGVTTNFFSVLGVQPDVGRGFTSDDGAADAAPVAVISDGLWHRMFGADPDIVGRTVSLDGLQHTVVGVMPPRFVFETSEVDAWTPLLLSGGNDRSTHWVRALGRIRDGYTLEQARTEMAGIAQELARAYPGDNAGNGVNLIRLRDDWFGEGFRQGSLISSVAVLFVLLIACANVANLLLARGANRSHEIALRSALGADRIRIVRQLLTESLVLSLAGGALGLFLSVYGIRGIKSLLPAWFPQRDAVALDGRVLLFTLLAALAAGVVFGLVPALRTSRTDTRATLQQGGTRGDTGSGGSLRNGLVAAEIALSMTLLVASGLLIKSFVGLQASDLGFDTEEILTARITLSEARYPEGDDLEAFYRDLLIRLEGLPGVEEAAGTHVLPLGGNSASYYALPSEAPLEPGRSPVTSFRSVTPGFFRAMGVELLAGRGFTEEDADGDTRVTVINRRFADRHWPQGDPVGERVELSTGIHKIVGLVENTWDFGPDSEPPAMIYLPSYESRSLGIVMRASSDPGDLVQPVREVVTALDPDQPVYQVATLDYLIRDDLGGFKAMVDILAALGAIALALSLAGVYGVMSYAVSTRTREVGIRMALGARAGDVVGLVLRQALFVALIGIGVGAGLALATARGLSFFLVGVSPFDPLPFAVTAALLVTAALAASYLPARRAATVDPASTLRAE